MQNRTIGTLFADALEIQVEIGDQLGIAASMGIISSRAITGQHFERAAQIMGLTYRKSLGSPFTGAAAN